MVYVADRHLIIMKYIRILALYAIMWPMVRSHTSTVGHFYQEQQLSNSDLMEETLASNSETWCHLCSLSEGCKYVVKDTRNGELSIKRTEADLPIDKRYLRIWKKIKPGEEPICAYCAALQYLSVRRIEFRGPGAKENYVAPCKRSKQK